MPKTTAAQATPLRDQLEKLAAIEPQQAPFISLYLNLSSDQHGRPQHDAFVRKAFAERQKAFPAETAERESFDKDTERINSYLANEVSPSSNGLAIFACAAADDFFEAIQLDAPVDEHWLFIGPVPHLYPLARVADRFPRYAVVVTDTAHARIVVLNLGGVQTKREITGVKTRRSSVGGWSQARYQRRADNFHLHHVKEVVDALDRVVRAEQIPHVIIAGDDEAVTLVKKELPKHLAEKVVDVMNLDPDIAEDELVTTTLETLQKKDAETDAQLVEEAVGAWQGQGLGVVGPDETLMALSMGEVDQLLITSRPDELKPAKTKLPDAVHGDMSAETSLPGGAADSDRLKIAAELISRAEQTGARIRFIEDPERLKRFGGVAAILRFRVKEVQS